MLVNSPDDFDMLQIGLASPDRIRYWSYGEVEKPETINYRTFKPERRGLFCEKIFGPVKDWECSCGKYRRVRYRGIVCERCGVEVTHSKVRRERMGHIELAAPVSHIWFLKGIPSFMGLLLDMSSRQLEEVIYYDSYIITRVDSSLEDILKVQQVLSQTEYIQYKEKFGNKFTADMGAGAVKTILSEIDVEKTMVQLRTEMEESKGQKRIKITKRLRLFEAIQKSKNSPAWMILDVIPVMPPDLRPMVQLEGGRFATSDLNDLYRRVVNRNNRLKRLMDIGAPEMIVRNEKRMLQESVDVLISNGKRGRSVTGTNGRPLKSLGNIIEGKQGRFRQNLLGKRVDYSARSVIVVGPHLKFHQCGLPKEMALELFKPFVIHKLVKDGMVSNVKSAKKKIERKDVMVWDALESVIKGQLVLLNRAPTLHRLGIQAFEPILVEGSAIQVHPLVCTAFNADFDGDQMAVHVPLSVEAQAEARLLIMSTNNILSPSSGKAIITPSQDMVLGCYFLTVEDPDLQLGKGKVFSDIHEAKRAWEAKYIGFHSQIQARIDGKRINTTVGRIIFNQSIRDTLKQFSIENEPYVNQIIGKKELGNLISKWFKQYGNEITAALANEMKRIGFKYSTLSGISISIDDLKIPDQKKVIVKEVEGEVEKLTKLQKDGHINQEEKQMRSNELWRGASQRIATELEGHLGRLNNLFIMANSGARGNMDQVRQLAGMRGLMSDAQGRTVSIPIKTNFKEGLSLTEYFISSYGARKGLVDTALRTADSGYLTRRLVDVAQDVMISIEDCGTTEGVALRPVKDGLNEVVSIEEMVAGRFTVDAVKDPSTGKTIVEANTLITEELANKIQQSGIREVITRSIYKCKAERGICQKCFGVDLASGQVISVGEAIGIIAAQSIGEPGTQLTMRTFHTGGVDLRRAANVDIVTKTAGKVSFSESLNVGQFKDVDGDVNQVVTQEGDLIVETTAGVKVPYSLPKGAVLQVSEGDTAKAKQVIAQYDPTYEIVVSHSEGQVKIIGGDLKQRKGGKGNVLEVFAESNAECFIYNPKEKLEIQIVESKAKQLQIGTRMRIVDEASSGQNRSGLIEKIEKLDKKIKGSKEQAFAVTVFPGESYALLPGARLFIQDGEKVKRGQVIARERIDSADASKTKDIVQGLPRVEELFEARKPKDSAVLSEVDGIVDVSDQEGYRLISVISESGQKFENKISYDMRLKVYSGKQVKKGEQLTDGVINPHDVLATQGVEATQLYLTEEVQRVYRSQGVQINSKHIEVIVRQMTRKVNVLTSGDTSLLPNDLVDMRQFDKENALFADQGKEIATGQRELLGVTRASLNTESFISASSFQQTASVLTKAAIEGQVDPMFGLKENVIIGKLIPAGTGLGYYNRVGLELPKNYNLVEEKAEEEVESLV